MDRAPGRVAGRGLAGARTVAIATAAASVTVCSGAHTGAAEENIMMRCGWLFGLVLVGCGGDKGSDTGADDTGGGALDRSQTPPTGYTALEAWISEGHYLAWACEPAAHENRSPSPHGFNRICSNDLLSAHGTGEYPVGAASVKELYADDATTIVGYAVALHGTAGTEGGDWYWYERVPLDHPAPHDSNGVVADGTGEAGPAMQICVGCHVAAGLDADHSGHDFIYTQVP